MMLLFEFVGSKAARPGLIVNSDQSADNMFHSEYELDEDM